jgi:adenosylmethionine-8-amino-7-oxononanoate aminotransferase
VESGKPQKYKVISRAVAYHGTMHGAMAITTASPPQFDNTSPQRHAGYGAGDCAPSAGRLVVAIDTGGLRA